MRKSIVRELLALLVLSFFALSSCHKSETVLEPESSLRAIAVEATADAVTFKAVSYTHLTLPTT